MNDLLSDEPTYKKLNNNSTNITQNTLGHLIKSLHRNEYIDLVTYKNLICHNGTIPKIGMVLLRSTRLTCLYSRLLQRYIVLIAFWKSLYIGY